MCTETLRNLTRYSYLFLEPYRVSAPGIWSLTRYLHRNPTEPHQLSAQQVSAPKSSRTSLGICTRTLWSLNLTTYLRRNLPKPHQVPAPELSGTLRNPPEPHRLSARNHQELHQLSAPEPSGRTSPGICTGTLRNLTRTLRNLAPGTLQNRCTGTLENPPEPCPEPGVEAAPDLTRANLG